MVKKKEFTNEEISDIKNRYTKLESLKNIGKSYNTSQSTITRVLKENKVRIRGCGEAREIFDNNQKQAIIEKFKKGKSCKKLAEEYETTGGTIARILKELNLDLVKIRGERRRKISNNKNESIALAYKSGRTLESLASEYEVGRDAIKRAVLEEDVQIRPPAFVHTLTNEQQNELAKLYKNGMNTVELGEKFGIYDTTVGDYLNKMGIERRQGKLSNDQKKEVLKRYEDGESSVDLGRSFEVSPSLILRVIDASNIDKRELGETQRQKSEKLVDINDISHRYINGESSISIARDYELTSTTIRGILKRKGIEIREGGVGGDSMLHIFNQTGNFTKTIETYFYIYSIKDHPHLLKPGITNNKRVRENESKGIYTEELFSVLLSSREEAYFLEQAILEETSAYEERPDDLSEINFGGISELRKMSQDELIDVYEFYRNQIDELGIWDFAATYVPMTDTEKKECLSRRHLLEDKNK